MAFTAMESRSNSPESGAAAAAAAADVAAPRVTLWTGAVSYTHLTLPTTPYV